MQISFSRIILDMQQVETLKHGDSEYVGLETIEQMHGDRATLRACPVRHHEEVGSLSATSRIRQRLSVEEALHRRLFDAGTRTRQITQYPGFAVPLCGSVDPGGYVLQLSPRH